MGANISTRTKCTMTCKLSSMLINRIHRGILNGPEKIL